MSNSIRDVGARMQSVRQPSGATQSKAAAMVGVSFGAYKNYEHGKREMPSSVAVRFSEVFEIDLTWLLTGKGQAAVVDQEAKVEETSAACFEIANRAPTKYTAERFGSFCRYVFKQIASKNTSATEEAIAIDKLIS